MKEWFKYEFGYVNIDVENLYLTNSGNWSETKDLAEKTVPITKKNDNKSTLIIVFLFVIVCIVGYFLYKSVISESLGLALVFLSIGTGLKAYQYLKTEIGSKFRVPLEKITDIKVNEKSVEINFINGDAIHDSYELIGIEEKGINIMLSLKNTLDNSPLAQA